VAHHAVADIFHDVGMAEGAGFVGDAEIAGVYELNEFGGFVIEEDGGIVWIGGALPEDGIARADVGFVLGEIGSGVAAVAIGATENDCGRRMHWFDASVALDAAVAFESSFGGRLIDAIARGQLAGVFEEEIARDGNWRAEAGRGSERGDSAQENWDKFQRAHVST
jgi:hypothetical protein